MFSIDKTTKVSPDTLSPSPAFVYEDARGGAFSFRDGLPVQQDGIATVRDWIRLMLRQRPAACPVYQLDGSVQPGIDRTILQSGLPFGFIYAEIQRQITETLLLHPSITGADGFSFSREGRALICAFTVRLANAASIEEVIKIDSK